MRHTRPAPEAGALAPGALPGGGGIPLPAPLPIPGAKYTKSIRVLAVPTGTTYVEAAEEAVVGAF